MSSKKESKKSFEEQIERLEEILELMNDQVPLDQALTLYEEASELMKACQNRLGEAQSKVEKILKDRNGEALLDESGEIQREPLETMS